MLPLPGSLPCWPRWFHCPPESSLSGNGLPGGAGVVRVLVPRPNHPSLWSFPGPRAPPGPLPASGDRSPALSRPAWPPGWVAVFWMKFPEPPRSALSTRSGVVGGGVSSPGGRCEESQSTQPPPSQGEASQGENRYDPQTAPLSLGEATEDGAAGEHHWQAGQAPGLGLLPRGRAGTAEPWRAGAPSHARALPVAGSTLGVREVPRLGGCR